MKIVADSKAGRPKQAVGANRKANRPKQAFGETLLYIVNTAR